MSVAHAAIPHALRGDRRQLRQRMLPLGNVVQALVDHRQHSAEVRVDDFQLRIFLRNARFDQMHDRNRVFHRRTDDPAQVERDHERRIDSVARRMDVQHRAAPVQLFKKWSEGRIGRGMIRGKRGHRRADKFQLVERALEFLERFVDMRQGHGREGLEFFRPAAHGLRVQVVGFSRGIHGVLFVFKVRRLRANVENLHLDAVRLHQGEALVHFFLAHPRALVALRPGVHISVALAEIEVIRSPEMRVNVDPHALLGLRPQPYSRQHPRRRERTRPQHIAPRETASAFHDGIASRTAFQFNFDEHCTPKRFGSTGTLACVLFTACK